MRDRSDRRWKGKENPGNMRPEMCISILGRSLMFCCILTVALFHHCDAVVEDKKTESSRDHRVTLIMDGIVPGIVNDNEKQTTLTRILSPSSAAGATTAPTTTTTTTAIFSRASRAPPTATLIERPVQPSTGRRTAAARSDCCFVGQAYAKTNMSCAFTSTASANEPAGKTLKGSEIKGQVGSMSWPDVVEGRAPLVGRRIDRMLLKCLTYDELEVHMKKCCRNEKKLVATRKCRRLINARRRRICRLDAATLDS